MEVELHAILDVAIRWRCELRHAPAASSPYSLDRGLSEPQNWCERGNEDIIPVLARNRTSVVRSVARQFYYAIPTLKELKSGGMKTVPLWRTSNLGSFMQYAHMGGTINSYANLLRKIHGKRPR